MVKDRLARAALVISVLMAFGGPAALAQEGEPPAADEGAASTPAAVSVFGTSTLVGQASPGTSELDGGVVRVRDNQLVTVEASSDPRVAGQATITVNFDAYPDASGLTGATQVRFGQMRLENEDGAWAGSFTGSLANGAFVQTYWLEGSGAYEGYSYVVTAGGSGNTWRSQGLIFPGAIPPMGGTSLPIDAIERDLPLAVAPPG